MGWKRIPPFEATSESEVTEEYVPPEERTRSMRRKSSEALDLLEVGTKNPQSWDWSTYHPRCL